MKNFKSFWEAVFTVVAVGIGVLIGFLLGLLAVTLVYFLKALPYIIVIGICLLIIFKCIV